MSSRLTIRIKALNRSPSVPVLGVTPQAGFSVLELVVVIAVLAILTSIGLPIFFDLIETAAVRAAQYSLTDAHKECLIAITKKLSTPTYRLPPNNSYFEFPDLGNDGECLSPQSGNILTAARTNGRQPSATYTISINVATGEKSSNAGIENVPSWVDW